MATQTQAGGSTSTTQQAMTTVQIPRIAIKFCTQCKWNLRAAYYAQELLQTFGTSIGEIALVPATGGIFTVTMTHAIAATSTDSSGFQAQGSDSPAQTIATPVTVAATDTVLWDRKMDGGFPETKELKSRVRNIIEPGRDLGHIDRSLKKGKTSQQESQAEEMVKSGSANGVSQEIGGGGGGHGDEEGKEKSKTECEDCK